MKTNPHQRFSAHPLILPAVAFILGILAVEVFKLALLPLLTFGAVASLIALLFLARQRPGIAALFLCAAFILAGSAIAVVEKQNVKANRLKLLLDNATVPMNEAVEVTGVLVQAPEPAPGSVYLTLRAESVKTRTTSQVVSGTVTLLLRLADSNRNQYQALQLYYGTRIRVTTALNRTDQFRNPGGSSFTEYLERKEFDAAGLIKNPLLIRRLGDDGVALPLAWLYGWRQKLQSEISSLFGPETAGVLSASLLGNRYFLSRSAAERFRDGGTFHVLVISGLHISFIGGLVLLLARRVAQRRLTQFIFSALVLWSYAIAVGAEASVVRAAVMFTFVAFAPVVGRRGSSLNALSAAVIILLAWRPKDLFDPSFQLTFLSVAAIVIFAWPLLQRMSKIGSWRPTRTTPYPPSAPRWLLTISEVLFWREQQWQREAAHLNYHYKLFKSPLAAKLERHRLQALLRYVFAAVVVSLCVQITLLPLLIVYFHRLSISALILNIVVSITMAALIFVGVAAILIGQVSSVLASLLIGLSDALNWLMVHCVDPFARFGIASIRLPEYSGWLFIVYLLFFVPLAFLAISLAGWLPLQRPARVIVSSRRVALWGVGGAQLLLSLILVLHPFSAPVGKGKLRVDFLDVGQGDAALLTMPNGTTLLIDGGGRPNFSRPQSDSGETPAPQRDTRSIGDAVVSEYLWWRGLDQVDYILATHADADHIQGLNDVARNFRVRAALAARTPEKDLEFTEFAATLNQQEIPLQVIAGGDQLKFGGATVRVLWPAAWENSEAKSGNNDSVVLRLEYGRHVILMLADIEKHAEAALVATQNQEPTLKADVVRVAHHGSRTSSIESFVGAVRPELAVISVGQRSMFGHPHAEVVERWRACGAQVLTTGKSGMITVTTDGKELQVTKFVER